MSKSRGIYSLKVEYDKEWENITERVVIFKRLVDGLILAIKDSTGQVAVPWEVTDKISQVEIGVIGYNENHEKIISTTAISGGNMILIAQATPNNGIEPLAPSPDIWNQIRGDIESLKSKTTQIEDTLNNKVDRDGSKVLSTNDYTDEDRDKLAGIEHGAEKNIQSDWNQVDTTADDYIKNKPENLAQDSNYVHTDNNFTDQDKLKLRDIEARAEVNKIDKVSDYSGRPLTITDKGVKLPDFALRSEITSVYKMKGSLSNLAEIQRVADKEIGDVYNAEDSGMNYVWNGSIWDALGSSVDLSVYYTKDESDNRYVQKETGKVLSSNDYTTNEKHKLAGIEEQAQKNPPIDTTLSETSKNAVENKVITTEMNKKAEKTDVEENSSIISDILNAFSKESDKGTNLKLSSSATKVLGMTIYGNTEQAKYTGKNLLQLSTNPTISNGLASTVSPDGLVKYSGKITDSWGDITTLLYFPAPLPAGKYTFSIDHPRTHRIIFKYRFADNSFNEVIANMTATSTSNTFTTTQPIIAGYLYIAAANGSSLNDAVKAQLEIGDTATDYEPYTGGYNNLFDEFSGLPINSVHGVTLSNQNGVLKLTGKPAVDWLPILVRENLPLLNKTTYTVVSYNGASSQLFAQLIAYKKDGSDADVFGSPSSKIFTFTADSTKYDRYVMKLQLGKKSAYPEAVTIFNNFALFAGEFTLDSLPEYSPYNTGLSTPRPQYPQVVKELGDALVQVHGKNLFDTRFGERTINGVSIKTYPDGSFELNGTPTNGFSLTNVFYSKSYVPAGKYKLKVEIISGSVSKVEPSATFLCVCTFQINKNIPESEYLREADISSSNVKEFVHTVNDVRNDIYTPYIWIPYHIENKRAFYSYNNLRMRATLVPNGDNTDFVEFESQQFAIPSGLNIYKLTDTIYDKVKFENGVAKLVKRVGKLELSGEESNLFLYKNTVSGTIGFSYGSKEDIFKQSKLIPDIICSHFNSVNEGDTWHGLLNSSGVSIFAGRENFPLSTKKIVFWFSLTDATNLKITDLASFKKWLKAEKDKGTPVTIYYEMKTPTEEEITDPTLLTELKKLMEMRTYQDVTNISITSTGATPEIRVKYMADFKKLLG